MTTQPASIDTPPKITVVIPTFNASATIRLTLASALNQTYPDIEFVVVDDGSRDDTLAKVRALSAVRPLRLIEVEQNGGAPRARNRGAAEGNGSLIAFLDSDDSWHPDKLRLQVEAMVAQPDAVLSYSLIRHEDEAGREIYTTVYRADGDLSEPLLTRNVVGSTSTAMVRRDAFEAVGGFDPDFKACQDWDLWVRLAKMGPFVCAPRPLTVLLHHGGVRITNNGRSRLRGYLQFYRRHLRARRRMGTALAPDFRGAFADVLLQSGRRRAASKFFLEAWLARPKSIRILLLAIVTRMGLTYQGTVKLNATLARWRR